MDNRAPQSESGQPLDRRAFLKFLVSGTLSCLVPPRLDGFQPESNLWPSLPVSSLPATAQEILKLVPPARLGQDGLLSLDTQANKPAPDIPLVRTNWNIENSHNYNQLLTGQPWGLVLHWFGDQNDGQKCLDFYLRGFNGVRQIGEYQTSTSAHFLVGDHPTIDGPTDLVGIVQTQIPAPDGTPYQAAHIRTLDFAAQEEGRHYFVLAMNQLNHTFPDVRPLLQEFYALPGVPAHMRTLAVEITGSDFDNPAHYPGPQKIANVMAVVRACMLRYQIPALNLMGHFELQLTKPDPGKKFLALIKYLVALLALVEPDQELKQWVFGPFLESSGSHQAAVKRYFQYLRQYLLLTTSPQHVYEWDAWSKYQIFYEKLTTGTPWPNESQTYFPPLKPPTWQGGFGFLVPENHNGIDIYPAPQTPAGNPRERQVHLLAAGTCIHLGESTGIHDGYLAVFRHRQVTGAEIITFYGHLDEFIDLQVGAEYPGGRAIGKINTAKSAPFGFLHFSIAYGPAWETSLHLNPNIPLNAGPTWIKGHFIDPVLFLSSLPSGIVIELNKTHIRPK